MAKKATESIGGEKEQVLLVCLHRFNRCKTRKPPNPSVIMKMAGSNEDLFVCEHRFIRWCHTEGIESVGAEDKEDSAFLQ
jgi:hypothetical protein